MKKYLVMALASASLMASAASAQSTFTFDEGNGGLGAGEILLASFDPGSTAGAVCGGTGCVFQTGSNGQGADPAVGSTGDLYLSVLGGGTATFTFADGLSQLGFDYGSADGYNFFQLLFAGGGVQNYSGQDFINGAADGNQSAPRTNGRLTIFANDGQTITGLILSSTQNSLEVDNFGSVAAVPEPATWAMMLMGFGAIGVSLRRRRRVSTMMLPAAV